MASHELNQRDREILRAIVRTFILTGEPVPSATISRLMKCRLSAASVRNIMSKLEAHGYLNQPHHSAGRVPTDRGYRLYVDSMRDPEGFSEKEAVEITSELTRTGAHFPDLFIETSKILSKFSRNIGVVLAPDMSNVVFEHIDFIKLGPGKIMVIFITKHGLLSHRTVDSDEDYTQTELSRIGSYLVNRMQGKTLLQVRNEIMKMMQDVREEYDSILKNAALLAARYFEQEMKGQDLFLEGTFNLFDKPELADTEKMKALFKTFEEKNRIVKLLNACLEGERVKVIIGSENLLPEMSDCSIIASRYCMESRPLGVVGIIGPTRMEYSKVMPLVDYLSHLMSRMMQMLHESATSSGRRSPERD